MEGKAVWRVELAGPELWNWNWSEMKKNGVDGLLYCHTLWEHGSDKMLNAHLHTSPLSCSILDVMR